MYFFFNSSGFLWPTLMTLAMMQPGNTGLGEKKYVSYNEMTQVFLNKLASSQFQKGKKNVTMKEALK